MHETYGSLIPTARLGDGKQRTILFDATKCIGCRQCVQACKDWNDLARTSPYKISSSNWITMEPPVLEGLSPLWGRNSCMHCDYPICAAVCPVEAISKCDEGAVVIDQEKCIGCEYCVYACPWGVIALHEVSKKATKCTMCHDRLSDGKSPFCVQACPVEALDFGLQEAMQTKAEGRLREVNGYLYGQVEAGGGRLLYVLTHPLKEYGLREVGSARYPRHRIPFWVMLKGLLTLTGGIGGKLRAIKSMIVHPSRLKYRYWPWRRPE